jgi:hypothetical protein
MGNLWTPFERQLTKDISPPHHCCGDAQLFVIFSSVRGSEIRMLNRRDCASGPTLAKDR